MLVLWLPAEIDRRLSNLAKRTGRSKNVHAREAILKHLDDVEDLYLARQALEEGGRRIPLEELIRKFASERP